MGSCRGISILAQGLFLDTVNRNLVAAYSVPFFASNEMSAATGEKALIIFT